MKKSRLAATMPVRSAACANRQFQNPEATKGEATLKARAVSAGLKSVLSQVLILNGLGIRIYQLD